MLRPEEFDRERMPVDVVRIAYGCGLGLTAVSCDIDGKWVELTEDAGGRIADMLCRLRKIMEPQEQVAGI